MTRHMDVQYVRFYTNGSAARKIETMEPKKAVAVKPKARKQKRIVLCIDPVAVAGIVVAAVMLVLMFVGVVQLQAARQEAVVMEQYVSDLQVRNAALQSDYEAGYDLEAVEEMALALGMVPKAQVQSIPIQVSQTEQEIQLNFWDRVTTFITGLFA